MFMSLSGAGVLFTIQGKEYKLSPLGFAELGEYILWYRYKEYYEAKLLTKDLPPDLRNELLAEAYRKCNKKRWELSDGVEAEISWETPEVRESLGTVEGISFQLYLSLKITLPNIRFEDCSKLVNLGNYNEINKQLLEVNGMVAETDQTDPLS